MSLKKWVSRIASASQRVRRRELLRILRETGCPYILYRDNLNGVWFENIVLSFNPGRPRLVLGAHYDSVRGSTGANDNAAAVSILLRMAEYYLKNDPGIPLDLVFFDLEEGHGVGSRAYLERVRKQDIKAMINLDICGTGDLILVAQGRSSGLIFRAMLRKTIRSHPVRVVKALPHGDEASFEKKGIPNLSVCIIPENEAEILAGFVPAMQKGKTPSVRPPIIETMHNGPRDSINTVKEKSMQTVLQWALAAVEALASASGK
ncbi:MAG: M28 family peptidase [Candidatus Wallbacteria bacterium]|nr:M28 family peptidase [Candidatus Wallbacteria bacterium]